MVEMAPEVIKQYRSDGAMVVRSAIDQSWLQRLAAAVERDITEPGPFDHSYDVGYAVRYCGDDVVYEQRRGIAKPLLDDDLQARDRLDSDQYRLIEWPKTAGAADHTALLRGGDGMEHRDG
jgi:hypothetical protein